MTSLEDVINRKITYLPTFFLHNILPTNNCQCVIIFLFTFVLGTKFRCSEVIAPVKSEADDINLYIINFEDLSAPSSPVEDVQSSIPLSKCELTTF